MKTIITMILLLVAGQASAGEQLPTTPLPQDERFLL